MYNLENLDYLLTKAITNYLTNNDIDNNSTVFVYLIRSTIDKWSLGILDFELASNPSVYKYRAVVEVTANDLVELQNNEDRRNDLLKTLTPNELTRYTNLQREANKDLN